MEMSNKKQEIPAIRFNGFTDAWEQRKLEEDISVVGGATPSKSNPEYWNGPIVWLSSQEIKEKYVSKGTYTITKKAVDDNTTKMVKAGTPLIVSRSGILARLFPISIPTTDVAINQDIKALIFDPNIITTNFFVAQLQKNEEFILRSIVKTGTTVQSINMPDFYKLLLSFPSTDEQEKVGKFFQRLDDAVALHQRQLDNYKELQKSLLQKIFNQELRFKDKYGDDYPEWEKEKLGNLITEVVEKSTIQDQYPILSSTNKGLFLQSEYFKSNIASDDNIGYKILRQNEIVFSPQNLWMGNINFNDKYEAGIVSPSYKIFSVNDGIVHEFMKFMIKTQYMMNEYVLSSEQGASIVRRNLDMELFNKIKVKIPTIPEQKKITDFLIASDDQIYQVAQRLGRLKEQKQGLMQRMFV